MFTKQNTFGNLRHPLSLRKRPRRIVISGEASGRDFINNESGAMREQRRVGGLYGDDLDVVGNTENNAIAQCEVEVKDCAGFKRFLRP